MGHFFLEKKNTVSDPVLPRGSANTRGDTNLLFSIIFADNCMKIIKIKIRLRRGASLAPPISATEIKSKFSKPVFKRYRTKRQS